MKLADLDETDSSWSCYSLADLEHAGRIAYYALKIISLLP